MDTEPQTRLRPRRTWPQRLTLSILVLAAVACFAAAGTLAAGQWVLSQRNLAPLTSTRTQGAAAADPDVVLPDSLGTPESGTTVAATPSTTDAPIVLAEPDAANFLVVGADNNDCAGDAVTGDRSDLGERSDTIMVWRANPQTNQLAVLSFPRDLYVEFPSGRKDRINAAYRRDDPSRLQEVINYNFGIQIDHYIQVDFCAFRKLVNAVGGIEVPFTYPAKDQKGDDPPLFLIEQTGCVNLDGDTALAYVRSRHYRYEDPPGSGNWVSDGTSDFGRIRRQQDFLRRVLAKVIADGLYDPDVVGALVTTNRDYITTDPDLTLRKMLEFANALRNFDAASVGTYRIESSSQTNPNGDQVEIPRIKGDNMQAILKIFRGEATLAEAPEQVFETTTTIARPAGTLAIEDSGSTSDDSPADSTDTAQDDESTSSTASTAPATTLPTVEVEDNSVGIAPDPAIRCD
jgi:LCP family protein required for cell wall assembly